jgi:hypothetical protein
MFVNLSNHPSRSWSQRQRDAAIALGGEIADQLFPEVAPEADLPFVEDLADEVLASLPELPQVAMVQGEFVLTAALVARLQARGVLVVAATTRRTVHELPDGRQVVAFDFVRFRPYPSLAHRL